MSFCAHCEGQRFDRARVLRLLRRSRAQLRRTGRDVSAREALTAAIEQIRRLDVPHLEMDDVMDGEIIH